MFLHDCSLTYSVVFGEQWATVGLYGGSLAPSGHMQLSDVHYSVAASVSVFQTFLRPLGLALTEETVREVVRREAGTVRRELSEIYSKLAIAAKKTYQLVSHHSFLCTRSFFTVSVAIYRSKMTPIFTNALFRIFPPI